MELTFEALEGAVTKVALSGKMDLAGAQQIDIRFNAVVGGASKVIVDLSAVSFVASMGLRTIIVGSNTLRSKGGKMVILSPQPDVEKVLTSSGVDTVIPIAHSLDAAVALLSA